MSPTRAPAKDALPAMANGLCGAKKRGGGTCKRPAGWGTNHVGAGRCKNHTGSTPSGQVSGLVELARPRAGTMGIPIDIDPHDAILECIRIAAGEVKYASDQIAELEEAEAVGPVQTSRPLKEEKGAENREIYVTEFGPPALHIWIKVRHEAMDRLAKYSKAALDAGIAERQVKVAEAQALLMAEAVRGILEDLGVANHPKAPKIVRSHLERVAKLGPGIDVVAEVAA